MKSKESQSRLTKEDCQCNRVEQAQKRKKTDAGQQTGRYQLKQKTHVPNKKC